jgi:hypothetical protein
MVGVTSGFLIWQANGGCAKKHADFQKRIQAIAFWSPLAAAQLLAACCHCLLLSVTTFYLLSPLASSACCHELLLGYL